MPGITLKISSFCQEIRWDYLEKLQQLQESEGLRAANKLTRAHINFCRQIMKVRLAAQTLSSSVSKALEFARLLGLTAFQGCEGTARFIADVDQ